MGKHHISKPRYISVEIPVYLVKEDHTFVAYSPVLELSSYGDTMDEAKDSFIEALEIFIEDTTQKGTLEKELLNLGWQLQRKPTPIYQPMVTSAHLNKMIPNTQKVFQERMNIPIS